MPPKSKKQERFMQAVANNPKFAKKVGVPTKVGKEFTKETKVKKYREGGELPKDQLMSGITIDEYNEMTDRQKAYARGVDNALIGGVKGSIRQVTDKALGAGKGSEKEAISKGYKEGKDAKKYKKKATKKKAGGKVGMGMTKNNYKKGGKVSSCSKRADGCAVKGKTKGRMI
jgi:hypothetical protein